MANDDIREYRVGDIGIRAGFSVVHASELAGGPIELAFYAAVQAGRSLRLLVTGDRMRARPGGIELAASLAGVPLPGLDEDVPDMGGPAMMDDVTPDAPFVPPVLVNDFIRLEAAIDALRDGQEAELQIACRRRVEAWPADKSEILVAESHLTLPLRRDDANLDALAAQLVDRLERLPRDERLVPLLLLLSLRAPLAVARWRKLARHRDPSVSSYVRLALAKLRH